MRIYPCNGYDSIQPVPKEFADQDMCKKDKFPNMAHRLIS
jgi:hypothetical protein